MNHKNILIIGLLSTITVVAGNSVQAEVREFRPYTNSWNVFVNNDTWEPEGFENGTAVPAPHIVANTIVIDGVDNETEWLSAPEVIVPLSYGDVDSVSVKALYSSSDVFIRVRWRDDSEDREHHPWVWDENAESYVTGPQIEDSVILSFEAGCEWFPSFLAGYTYDFDGWQWLAARSDPIGQALDLAGTMQYRDKKGKGFTAYQSRNTEDIWNLKFIHNGERALYTSWDQLNRVYMHQKAVETVYFRGVPDSYREPPAFVEQLAAPVNPPVGQKETYPQSLPIRLEDGAGEVAAKGQWKDGYWTVEFRRILVTPARTANDTMFTRLTQFSVHVFDHVERIDQSSESGRLFLKFLEPKLLLVTD